jgi:hypothetical protein
MQIRFKLQKRNERSATQMKSDNPVKQPHPRSKKPEIRKINNDEGK